MTHEIIEMSPDKLFKKLLKYFKIPEVTFLKSEVLVFEVFLFIHRSKIIALYYSPISTLHILMDLTYYISSTYPIGTVFSMEQHEAVNEAIKQREDQEGSHRRFWKQRFNA